MDVKVLLPDEVAISKECIEAADGDELLAGILYRRGIDTPDKIKIFLNEDEYEPFEPSTFSGMEETLKIILKKSDENAKVCIYGDYDVDGITSTVLLKEGLDPFFSHVVYHIPHRFTEGYGMNSDVIESLKAEGIDLIITCDCGISNFEEIDLARCLGMDVIITDHHTPPDILPPANTILNPKLCGEKNPLYPLPGVGVAYMLVKALYEKVGYDIPQGQWLDLVALGIIADVVPVLDECRYLLKKGLPYLISPDRIGLKALYNVIGNNCIIEDEEDIAFQIAPRINAAGRMDNPYLPVSLLLESNWDKAIKKAIELDSLNSRRKVLQNEIFEQAITLIEEKQKDKSILVLYHPDWHEGVLGIVAGKVAEQYKRPCICLTLKDDGITATGSARSVGDISIYDILADSREYLEKFGGHNQAAGMSLNIGNIESFTQYIQGLVPLEKVVQDDIVDIDVEAAISAIDDIMLRRIESLAPFGHKFAKPVFLSKNVEILSHRPIGKNHRRFIFSRNGEQLDGIWWWASPIFDEDELDNVDVVYTLGRNRGKISLTILNMKKSNAAKRKISKSLLHDINWHDCRKQPIASILEKYDGASVYYEGLRSGFKYGVDRYGVEKCETLVLLSVPPAPAIFREIVILSQAKDIILAFTDEDIMDIKQFMNQLQKILKYIIEGKNGATTIQDLSVLMCAPEELMEIALEYLKEVGFIDYILEDMDQITIYRGKKRTKTNKSRRLGRLLHNGFHEMIAFKRYMLSREVGDMKNICN